MAISEKLRKKLEKRKEDLKKGNGNFNTIIFKEGTTRIRILPVGDQDFAAEASQFFLGKDGAIISPASFGKPCAIMDAYDELKSSENEDDKELASKFKPSKRYFAPAIKFEDEKGKTIDGGPKLAILPYTVYIDLIDLMVDDENGDFTDPKEGYDVKIKREGSGKNGTTYSVLTCRPSALPKELRKKIFDPESMVKEILPTYEDTEKAINAYLNVDDEDEDDTPKKKKKKPGKISADMEEKKAKKKKKKK